MEDTVREMPAVALRGMTIFPDMIIHFDLSREKSICAVEKAMMGGQQIFLVTQKDKEEEDPDFEGVYSIGTIAFVKQIIKLPKNLVRILVEGMERGELLGFEEDKTCLMARVAEKKKEAREIIDAIEGEALGRMLRELFGEYGSLYPRVGQAIAGQIADIYNLDKLTDQIAMNMPISYEQKQKLLEELDVRKRAELLAKILGDEIQIIKVKQEIQQGVKEKIDKNQKEYILKEQLSFIRKELGSKDGYSEVKRYEEALETLCASQEVKDKIKREIERLNNVSANSSESSVISGYIETLLELPWDLSKEDIEDLDYAENVLNEDHYGLEKVKERMLEFLAVRNMTKKGNSPIICLVGPPGTGKTSIARSVARALGREYVRISLGGVRDEAEIRGHRRTYIGAMPGRIAKGLKGAGVKNPLMLLDEIDKISSDYKGDTASALLEVLDSEQNVKFRDHYVELPIDLSQVLFIATANATSTIPRPLLDRMEVIEINSYTANEKVHIAKEHLIPKQLEKHGLESRQLTIQEKAMEKIVRSYTKEAGVRNLERKIGEICRKAVREIYQKGKKGIRITEKNLEKYLGKEKYQYHMANKVNEIGIVTGLAWTSVGGDTLQIEVNIMPGKGEILLTGQLGEVMQESARIGISYIRSIGEKYKVEPSYFKKHDFHIHLPEGAVPKDGPSAGITMATALISAITKTPVRADVAMTGEITLRGRVLPIGGLKEKILAAKNAGMKTVLVPKKNERDVAEISEEIKGGIEIFYVEVMEDVLAYALCKEEDIGKDQKNKNGN